MYIVCVDDEPLAVEDTLAMCRSIYSDVYAKGFCKVDDALEWISSNPIDIALLDIDMPDMNGITMAARLRELKPDMVILFLTAYKEFAYDSFSVHPSGYLLKPVMPQVLKSEIEYAMSSRPKKDIQLIKARTFGNFDLFVKGKQVTFKRSKAKEMMAFLIDRRGMSVTRAEISAILFEDSLYDHSRQKYLDAIIRSLRDTLKEYGIEDLLQMERTGLRIIPEKIDCDMYRFYQGDSEAIRSFRGEYMESYPWASMIEADMLSIRDNHGKK